MEFKYTKKDIIKKINDAALLYQKNLLNKNIMFVFENKDNSLSYIETLFRDKNFQHLTGLKYKYNSKRFFNDCIANVISPNDIFISDDKIVFTYLKLEVLLSAMSINKIAKRIGDYNYHREKVQIEKVIGNVSLCIGFSNTNEKGKVLKYYYPQTLLKDKINYNTLNTNKIVAILSKEKYKELYDEITYLSNDITFTRLFDNNKIGELINYETVFSNNFKYQEKIDDFFNDMRALEESNEILSSGDYERTIEEKDIFDKDPTDDLF